MVTGHNDWKKTVAALSQADAKRDFLTVCRGAIQNEERAYVKDKADKAYLTLDPELRHHSGPVLDIRAQFFKDNFSRCSSLVKDGLCFRLTLRGTNQCVYARRHTKYSDPCDTVIENWRSQVVNNALAQQQEANLIRKIAWFERQSDSGREDVLGAIKELKFGIAHMAIGHRPFDEGQIQQDG